MRNSLADLNPQNSFENAPQFDVLVIPGSFSSEELPVSASTFLTTQTAHSDAIAVLSVSSGILTLAQTGLLHEKKATGPPSLLPNLRQRFPETNWQDTPWVHHDNVWSSSSAVTAIDMFATWMRQYFWDRSEALETALLAAGIPRLEEY
jgi:transcriptional regulator GlxA family with amidase domain